MDERRPKRRKDKDKDNPYTLSCRDGRYYITFKDGQSVDQCIEISEELFQVFDRFELDDLRHIHIVERHMEHSVVYEKTLYKRSGRYEESAEEKVIWKLTVHELDSAISLLPEVEKRRLVFKYFAGMTYKKIAEIENTSTSSVVRSISAAKKKIKKLLE